MKDYTRAGAHVRDPVVHVRVWGNYGDAKTPRMHRRLGSATLPQLAFLRESNSNFPWEKSHRESTIAKSMYIKKMNLKEQETCRDKQTNNSREM